MLRLLSLNFLRLFISKRFIMKFHNYNYKKKTTLIFLHNNKHFIAGKWTGGQIKFYK